MVNFLGSKGSGRGFVLGVPRPSRTDGSQKGRAGHGVCLLHGEAGPLVGGGLQHGGIGPWLLRAFLALRRF